MHKYYEIYYTWVTTIGVVLDVLTGDHADALLFSLARYISHRGCTEQILTVKGPVFALSKVQLFAAKRNIKLIFNPEEAPCFGGF